MRRKQIKRIAKINQKREDYILKELQKSEKQRRKDKIAREKAKEEKLKMKAARLRGRKKRTQVILNSNWENSLKPE